MLFCYQRYGSGEGRSELGKLAFWYCLDVLLLWRIWHASEAAWVILVLLDGVAVAELVFGMVWPWGLYGTGLLAIVLAQFVLLLSPAMCRRRPVRRA
ncbi:MAG TPA: hypothetical protein VGI64_03025 [Streptosporangiaceae bacterium]